MRTSLFFVALAVLLSACSSAPTRSLYLLDEAPGAQPAEAVDSSRPALVLGQVELAAFLDQSGLVLQTGPQEVTVAAHHRWASPLLDQLRQALLTELAGAVAPVSVFDGGQGAPDGSLRLDLTVSAFHGHFDGHARVGGQWRLLDDDGAIIRRGRFAARPALQGDGYTALVNALAAGWRDAATTMARQLSPALPR